MRTTCFQNLKDNKKSGNNCSVNRILDIVRRNERKKETGRFYGRRNLPPGPRRISKTSTGRRRGRAGHRELNSVRDTIHKAQTAVDVATLSRVVTPLTCVSFFEWSIAGRTLERGYFQKYHLPLLPRLELSHCHQIIAYRHHAGLAIGELKVRGEFKSVYAPNLKIEKI